MTLGDWSDPLDPDVETQTIYKQLIQGRDKLRSGVWAVVLIAASRGLHGNIDAPLYVTIRITQEALLFSVCLFFNH